MFVEIDAVVGRSDGRPITGEERDRFVDELVAWLEARGLEICGSFGLVDEEERPLD